MSKNYEQSIKQIFQLKKDLNQSKLYSNKLQYQLKTIESQKNLLQTQNLKLTQNNSVLQQKIRQINNEKLRVQEEYQTIIKMIKEQIQQKQIQMQKIKQKIIPNFDYEITRMKIIHELQDQYTDKITKREQQLSEIQNQMIEYRRQNQLLQEKLIIKEKYVNKIINEMRQDHINEIQTLTKTINKATTVQDHSVKELIKKLRRDNEQLKLMLNLKQEELSELREEKSKLKNEINDFVIFNNKSMEKLKNQIRIHKNEVDNLNKILKDINNQKQKEKIFGTQKDREIKKLTQNIEELHDQINSKERKINKLNEQISQNHQQAQKLKSKDQNAEQKYNLQILKMNLFDLQRDSKALRERIQDLKKINKQYEDKITKYQIQIQYLTQNNNNRNKYNPNKTITQGISNNNNITDNAQQNLELKQIINKLEQQKLKIFEKYQTVKVKLKEANSKIITLIQNKIINNSKDSIKNNLLMNGLISPNPGNKKRFQFPTQQKTITNNNPILISDLENPLNTQFYGERKKSIFLSPPLSPVYVPMKSDQYFNMSLQSGGTNQFYQKSKGFVLDKDQKKSCNHKHH